MTNKHLYTISTIEITLLEQPEKIFEINFENLPEDVEIQTLSRVYIECQYKPKHPLLRWRPVTIDQTAVDQLVNTLVKFNTNLAEMFLLEENHEQLPAIFSSTIANNWKSHLDYRLSSDSCILLTPYHPFYLERILEVQASKPKDRGLALIKTLGKRKQRQTGRYIEHPVEIVATYEEYIRRQKEIDYPDPITDALINSSLPDDGTYQGYKILVLEDDARLSSDKKHLPGIVTTSPQLIFHKSNRLPKLMSVYTFDGLDFDISVNNAGQCCIFCPTKNTLY